MDTLSCLRWQNKIADTERYSFEKLPPLLPEMQAGNADRSGELESNRYKETGNLISICTPPCMDNTIAAVFLHLSAVSVKGFLSYLLLLQLSEPVSNGEAQTVCSFP